MKNSNFEVKLEGINLQYKAPTKEEPKHRFAFKAKDDVLTLPMDEKNIRNYTTVV
jgi:hypothetical protein